MQKGTKKSQLQGRFRTTRRRAHEQSAPFSILGRTSKLWSRSLFERIGVSVGIPLLVAVQALEILFNQDGQSACRIRAVARLRCRRGPWWTIR